MSRITSEIMAIVTGNNLNFGQISQVFWLDALGNIPFLLKFKLKKIVLILFYCWLVIGQCGLESYAIG